MECPFVHICFLIEASLDFQHLIWLCTHSFRALTKLDLTRRKLPYNVFFRKCWTWLGFCAKAHRNFKSPMESHQAKNLSIVVSLGTFSGFSRNHAFWMFPLGSTTFVELHRHWTILDLTFFWMGCSCCWRFASPSQNHLHLQSSFSTLAGSGCIPLASKKTRSGLIPLIIHLSLTSIILFPKHRDLQCGNKHRLSKQFWKIYFFSQITGILTLFFSE